MRYLVTGGAGFIGSNIVDALINEGHEVLIIDNLATGKLSNLNPKVNFHQLDITDEDKITPLFKGVDGVFHTAALARIQPSFENPDLYFRVNAVGTRNVLMAAKKHGVRRVIYSASSSAYGPNSPMPLKEDYKVDSHSPHPYASTKRMGEKLMKDLGKITGGPETVCLRYFNVYGHRQSTDADGPYATAIGIFIGLAKKGKPLTIVPDGHQKRDFTWVGDVARANLLAMASPKVGNAEIINIGSGRNYSVWDVARLILRIRPEINPEELISSGKCAFLSPRQGEVRESLADVRRAKEFLDWEPTMNLEQGLTQLI